MCADVRDLIFSVDEDPPGTAHHSGLTEQQEATQKGSTAQDDECGTGQEAVPQGSAAAP